MNMLPDVDETGYDEWHNQLFNEEADRKIHGLALSQQAGERMADLSRIGAWAATEYASSQPPAQAAEPPPAPQPEPQQPAQEDAAPTAAVPPEPAPAPMPTQGVGPAPPLRPGVSAAPPTPPAAPSAAPDWENQVFGQALGAVSRAGGDAQAFADRFGQSLSGAQDVQSIYGQALGAASAAGADVQAFANTFQPPERPAAPPPPAALSGEVTTGGGAAGGVAGGALQEFARQSAVKAGVDPDIFTRQIQQESGFNPNARSPAGATGVAQFMPATAQGMGIDPTDPYQSLDAGARLMRQNLDKYGGDYAKALAAYNAGPGNVDKYGGVPPFEETQRYVSTILGGAGQKVKEVAGAVGRAVGGAVSDISQFGDPQLTNDEAYAACGPAAAVRFAQRFGRNPSLREATDLARSVGWTSGQGMAGLSSEQALMNKLGVPTKLVSGADWGTFANEAKTGNPVTISTRGHYFTADGWDPQTNRFHVGRSGLDLKGGAEWMTPEQMTALMGDVQGGLLADNPQVAAPSSADQETNPVGWLDRTKKSMADALSGGSANGGGNPLQQGIIEPLRGALSLESTPDPHDLAAAQLDMSVLRAGSSPGAEPMQSAAQVGTPQPLEQPAAQPAQQTEQNVWDRVGSGIADVFRNAFSPSGRPMTAAMQPTPSDVLTNPLGTGNAQPNLPQPSQPGLPVRQDIRDIAQEPQPSLLERITDTSNRPLSPGAPLREAIANAPVLGGVLGMARGPALLSDRDLIDMATRDNPEGLDVARQYARLGTRGREPSEAEIAEVLRGFRTGEAAAMAEAGVGPARTAGEAAAPAVRTGAGILQGAVDRLGGYPEQVAAPLREWAAAMDAPASQVGATLLRWMEENPASAVARSISEPTTGQVSSAAARATGRQAVGELTRAIGGGRGGPGMPGGAMPGQLPFEGGLPVGGPRPAGGEALGPSGGMPGQQFLEGGLPMGGPRPGPGGGEAGPGMAPPEINLPGYVGDSVRRIIDRSWGEIDAVTQNARSGKVEPGVLEDLAGAAKVSVDRARAVLKLDDPANSETAYALRQAFGDQADRVRQAQQALRDAPDSMDATRTLVREIAGQRALQETVAGVAPRAGRALEQFSHDEQLGEMAKRFKMTPEEFTSHLRDKADFTDPANVADLAKKAYGYTFGDKAMAVYYFNLLSNPLTHVRNMVGNTTAALTAPIEKGGAALFDPLARRVLGETGPRQRYIQELPAEYVGMIEALPDSARQGLRRLQLGVSDRATTSELTGPIGEAFGGGLKNPINWPTRALASSDDFFRGANEGAAHYGLANRIARQEGHTGQALTDRIAELINHPDEGMLDNIAKQGAYRVFQQESKWADKVSGWRGDSALGRFLLPFVKTPLNLMGYALERSPAGAGGILKDLATESGRAGLREKGAGDLADRMSRAAIGSAVWGTLAKQAFEGNLTGKMPQDPTERDAFRREGKQPFSFRNPRDGTWVSYQPLSPYSTLFASAAGVADAYRKGKVDDESVAALGLHMMVGFADGLLDTQWTQQLTDVLDIVNGGVQDPGDKINKFFTRQAANVNPGFLRGFAQATDRTLRDPQNPIEGMLAGNPFTQGMVRSQLNAWGQPIQRPIGGAEAFINPFNPSTPTTDPNNPAALDPVEKELRRLEDIGVKDLRVEPSLVGKDVSVLGQATEMTDEQQRHYQELSGYLAKTLLDLMVGSKEYESKSNGEKAQLIKDIYETTRKSVRESMVPDLVVQAAAAHTRDVERERAAGGATPTPTEEAPVAPTLQPGNGPVRSSGPAISGGPASSSGGPVRSSGSPVPRP